MKIKRDVTFGSCIIFVVAADNPHSVINNVLQLAPAVTLVEQLRMPCGVCKSNDLNGTLLTGMLNAARLSCFAHCNI